MYLYSTEFFDVKEKRWKLKAYKKRHIHLAIVLLKVSGANIVMSLKHNTFHLLI